MKSVALTLVVSLGIAVIACSSDETPAPSGNTSSSSSSSSGTAGTSGTSGASGTSSSSSSSSGTAGDDDDTEEKQGTISSCDLGTDGGYCVQFVPEAPKNVAKVNCDGAKSTLGWNGVVKDTEGCPTTNRVGTCVVNRANIDKQPFTNVYYSPKFTSATAKENCEGESIKGTFTPN